MKKGLLFTLLIAICLAGFAQFIRTDLGVYPEPPPPPLPAAGGYLVDPTFGTTLLRVTDALDGNDNTHAYSYWPCFNKNSTLLYIFSVSGVNTLYDFDTVAMATSNKRALFASNPPNDGTPRGEDAIWSGTQNNVMLCHTAQKLYSYNVVLNQYTLIHDFSVAYPNIYLNQMSRSMNDDVFAFTYKENVNYTNVGYIHYKNSTNVADTGNLSTMDEVQVDKTGNYLVIKTGMSGPSVIEVQILDLQTLTLEDLTDNGPDFSPGHSDNGMGFVIGADNWQNRYLRRSLSTPHQFITIIDHFNDWSLGDHASMLADDESWILFSTYVANTLPSTGVFADELYQVRTDGSQSVRRLVHTHSDYLNQSPNNQYWSSPRANISRNGKFAVFTSNWGSTTRLDVFVLRIPLPTPNGIAENSDTFFSIYPNPSNGTFSIECAEEILGIELYNTLGEKVFISNTRTNKFEIDLNTIAKGIYFVSVKTADQISTRKIVIN